MSKLDAFFHKGFRGAKCKTLLKLALPRIKLLRNRREVQLKQLRKEIAKLLQTGHEATACIRVEHIIREQKMKEAHEIIELFCELIVVRLPILETQRECPLDLKEAISTICFAAPRCADLPELLQVQTLFVAKYGKEFVVAATELMPDCAVNRQVIELLSVYAPPVEEKLKLLKEIAEEHELDWDPTATEKEFLKSHEDLLHGQTKLTTGSKVPSRKEKRVQAFYPGTVADSHKQSDSETALGAPYPSEVPQGSDRQKIESGITTNAALAASSQDSSPSSVMDAHGISGHIKQHRGEDASGATSCGRENLGLAKNGSAPGQPCYAGPNSSDNRVEMLPSNLVGAFSSTSCTAPDSKPHGKEMRLHPDRVKLESPIYLAPRNLLETTGKIHLHASLDSRATSYADDKSSTPQEGKKISCSPQVTFGSSLNQHPPSISRTKLDSPISFQDALVAAEQAAETAKRAAAAARAAAGLAQIKISESELYMNKNNDLIEIGKNGYFHKKESHDSLSVASMKYVNNGDEPSCPLAPQAEEQPPRSETSDTPSYGTSLRGSSGFGEQADGYLSSHQLQRSSSMDDDPYFHYPNLFTSQGSNSHHPGY